MKILLLMFLFFSGCASLSSSLAPTELKIVVKRAYEVSKISVLQPPQGQDLTNYFKINAQYWEQIYIFYYGVKNE